MQVQGFGMSGNQNDEDDDLENMFGGPLEDLSQVQVGDAAREIKVKR